MIHRFSAALLLAAVFLAGCSSTPTEPPLSASCDGREPPAGVSFLDGCHGDYARAAEQPVFYHWDGEWKPLPADGALTEPESWPCYSRERLAADNIPPEVSDGLFICEDN